MQELVSPLIPSDCRASQDVIAILIELVTTGASAMTFVKLIQPGICRENVVHHFGIAGIRINVVPET